MLGHPGGDLLAINLANGGGVSDCLDSASCWARKKLARETHLSSWSTSLFPHDGGVGTIVFPAGVPKVPSLRIRPRRAPAVLVFLPG